MNFKEKTDRTRLLIEEAFSRIQRRTGNRSKTMKAMLRTIPRTIPRGSPLFPARGALGTAASCLRAAEALGEECVALEEAHRLAELAVKLSGAGLDWGRWWKVNRPKKVLTWGERQARLRDRYETD